MKKAFTLIELLIVIGIIAILAGVLLSTFGGATESARLAKCQANLRSLAAAVNTYAMESGSYPHAGSCQYMKSSLNEAGDVTIGVYKGWVSWLDKGEFKSDTTQEKSISQSSYVGTDDEVSHALTNGAIWKATGRNRSLYQCPVHQKTCLRLKGRQPGWSYAMNAYFRTERAKGKATVEGDSISFNGLKRADRRLLFAEIQGLELNTADTSKYGADGLPKVAMEGSATDGILQYQSDSGSTEGDAGSAAESMGFNHIRGKRVVGLVAFADGHTEAITLPREGDLKQLTGWLCGGFDVAFTTTGFEKLQSNANEAE